MKQIFTIFLGIFLGIHSLNAAYIFVKYDAVGANDGSSWADAFTDLQDALTAAAVDDSVFVAKGVYIPDPSDTQVSFELKQGVAIFGGFEGSETTFGAIIMNSRDFVANESILCGDIQGDGTLANNTRRIVYGTNIDSTARLDGFSIKYGYAGESNQNYGCGGAIHLINYASPTLMNLVVDSCQTYEGGAIYCNNDCDPWVENVVIKNCRQNASWNDAAGVKLLTGSDATFKGCLIINNYALGAGGGIYCSASAPAIINTTISNNTAEYGGGMYNTNESSPVLINTIIWDNTAYGMGYDAYGEIRNSTTPKSIPAFSYCILKNSGGSDNWNSNFGSDEGYNSDSNPLFKDAENDDYSVFEVSTAIAAGNPVYGNNIGFYQESGVSLPGPIFVKADATGNNDGTDWTNAYTSLKEAIKHAVAYQPVYVAKGVYLPDASERDSSFSFNNLRVYGGFAGNESSVDQSVIDNRDFITNETILSGDLNGDDDGFSNNTENSYRVVNIPNASAMTLLDGFTVSGGNANGTSIKDAGGLFVSIGEAVFNNLILKYNYASDNGGAIMVYNSSACFVNLVAVNNKSNDQGGALYVYSGAPTFKNTLIANNESYDDGGGIYCYEDASPVFINATIANNRVISSFADGGAMHMYNDCFPRFINTILWGNTSRSIHQVFSYVSNNPGYTNSIIQYAGGSEDWKISGTDNGNNLDTIPYFVDIENNDASVYNISMAIGNGTEGNNIGYYQGAGIELPAPLYVKAGATGNNDGSDWDNAITELKAALKVAIPFQKIFVAKGTYKPAVSYRDSAFSIGSGIQLYGGLEGNEINIDSAILADRDFVTNETVLSGDLLGDDINFQNFGDNSYHVLTTSYTDEFTLVDGFTIKGGAANSTFGSKSSGGGIYNYSGNVTLKSILFTENYSYNEGGALYNYYYSNPTLINCTFVKNKANDFGAAIYNYDHSNVIMINTIIWDNESAGGSDLYSSYSSDGEISYSLIEGTGGSENWTSSNADDYGNNIDIDPLFVDVADGDFRLIAGSSALGNGNPKYNENIGVYKGAGVSVPAILTISDLSHFGKVKVGETTYSQQYEVWGFNLAEELWIVAPEGIELSFDSTDYTGNTDTLRVSSLEPTFDTVVYLRYAPEYTYESGGEIIHQSGDAEVKLVTASGLVAIPEIDINDTYHSFSDVVIGEFSAEMSYVLSGEYLIDDIIISASEGFHLSFFSGDYSGKTDTLIITPVNETIEDTTIYIRFVPEALKYYSGSIKHESEGSSYVTMSVNGDGVRPPIIYVNKDASGLKNGMSWEDAYTDIHDALIEASAGDTIIVAKGTYFPSTSSRSAYFDMDNNIVMLGGFSGTENSIDSITIANRDFIQNETILSGDLNNDDYSGGSNIENSYHIVVFDTDKNGNMENNTILDGFTIKGGNANGDWPAVSGGGIYFTTSYDEVCSPILRNLRIIDNYAQIWGGGIYVMAGASNTVTSPVIENCQFINNQAGQDGGGLYVGTGPETLSEAIIDYCNFESNKASYGGGIHLAGICEGSNNSVVRNCEFINNTGGGIFAMVDDAGTSCENVPGYADIMIYNNSLYNNDLIFSKRLGTLNVEVYNTIMWDAGVTNYNDASPAFTNSILYGSNGSGAGWNSLYGTDGGHNLDQDPLFVDAESGDLRLLDGSPALGAGDITYGSNIGKYQDAGLDNPPSITVTSSMDDFGNVFVEAESSEQTYTIAANHLVDKLFIVIPDGFAGSLSGGGEFLYEDTIVLQPEAGIVNETVIYVKFLPTAAGNYSGQIIHKSQDAISKTIPVSGNGSDYPEISLTGSLNDFGSVEIGSWSTAQSFELRGENLLSDVTVFPPKDFEISDDYGDVYTNINPLVLTPLEGTLAPITLYTRFVPKNNIIYTDSIKISTEGDLAYLTVSGTGTGTPIPVISVSDTEYDFGDVNVNDVSEPFSFTISANNLTDNLVIRTVSILEISLFENSGYTTDSIVIDPVLQEVAPTTVYVRAAPIMHGTIDERITISSGETGAYVQILANGVVYIPQILSSGGLALFGPVMADEYSTTQIINISGNQLLDDLVVSTTEPFEISLTDAPAFTPVDSIVIEEEGGSASANVYIRYMSLETGVYSGHLWISTTDAYQSIDLTGITEGAPSISAIDDYTLCHHESYSYIYFEVNDDDIMNVNVSAFSSNQNFILDDMLQVTGSYYGKTLQINPMMDVYGETTITVIATDGEGLSDSVSFVYSMYQAPSFYYNKTDVRCFGESTGEIQILIIDSVGMYEYSMNGIDYQSSNKFSGLTEGSYEIYVRNEHGCVDNNSAILIDAPPQIMLNEETITVFHISDEEPGTIQVNAYGGTGLLIYALDNGEFQESIFFHDMGAGEHVIHAMDENGCTVDYSVTVEDLTSSVYDMLTKSVMIYPNPATKWINIRSDIEFRDQVHFYDVVGNQQILTIENENMIRLDKLVPGLYIMELKTVDGKYVRRQVIRE